jgi:hypothetical protein
MIRAKRMTLVRMSDTQTVYLPWDFTMGERAVVKCTPKKTEAFYWTSREEREDGFVKLTGHATYRASYPAAEDISHVKCHDIVGILDAQRALRRSMVRFAGIYNHFVNYYAVTVIRNFFFSSVKSAAIFYISNYYKLTYSLYNVTKTTTFQNFLCYPMSISRYVLRCPIWDSAALHVEMWMSA